MELLVPQYAPEPALVSLNMVPPMPVTSGRLAGNWTALPCVPRERSPCRSAACPTRNRLAPLRHGDSLRIRLLRHTAEDRRTVVLADRVMKTIPLLLAVSGLAFGQAVAPGCSAISPDAAKKQFEAASVKPAEPLKPPTGLYTPANNPFAVMGGPGTGDPGRFTSAHAALSSLIMRAYGLDADRLKAPSWVSNHV